MQEYWTGSLVFEDKNHPKWPIRYRLARVSSGQLWLFKNDDEEPLSTRQTLMSLLEQLLWAAIDNQPLDDERVRNVWPNGVTPNNLQQHVNRLRKELDDVEPSQVSRVIATTGTKPKVYRFLLPAQHVSAAARVEPSEILPATDLAVISDSPSIRRFPSNIPSRGDLPFVGRDSFMQYLQKEFENLSREKVVVICGPPGVGKSELAFEFARCFQTNYTGGTFFIKASAGAIAADLASIGNDFLGLSYPDTLPAKKRGEHAFFNLGLRPTLLIYDNVVEYSAVSSWLPLHGMLCHVLITTGIGISEIRWPHLKITKLEINKETLGLVEEVAEMVEKGVGSEVARLYGNAIARHADGLPLQIVYAARDAAFKYVDGEVYQPSLASEAKASFAGPCNRLSPSARLLVHCAACFNFDRIPKRELSQGLATSIGWTTSDFDRAWVTCRREHLLTGTTDLRMPQLIAEYLRAAEVSGGEAEKIKAFRCAQFQRLGLLATQVATDTGNSDLIGILMSYPVTPAEWRDIGDVVDADVRSQADLAQALNETGHFHQAHLWALKAITASKQLLQSGRSLDRFLVMRSMYYLGASHYGLGAFRKAEPWLRLALRESCEQEESKTELTPVVTVMSLGDCLLAQGQFDEAYSHYVAAVKVNEGMKTRGQSDDRLMVRSLYNVANCLLAQYKDREAWPWCERAVMTARTAEVNSAIDFASLGACMEALAAALLSAGKDREAEKWFKEAVDATERGDQYGRVDYLNVGIAKHALAALYHAQHRFNEALVEIKNAVTDKRKGDIFGRVDSQALGKSMLLAGLCFGALGKPDKALRWSLKGAMEIRRGDVYGQVDHAVLGGALFQIGVHLVNADCLEDAIAAFNASVNANRKGDQFGRIDHKTVSVALHEIGWCMHGLKGSQEAIPWFENALTAAKLGDLKGNIDEAQIIAYQDVLKEFIDGPQTSASAKD
ncbi:MAG TPA: tetratricopeptide repeat protein [Bryobacteraceae bacterium]|nr:tetratricopeptide repeat protein [Bryobacteraceae bacterium]